jgi:putative ABC transport system permease protein
MIISWTYNFRIATEAILQNKVRSVLTSLGIIFGVASVIAMLAIGSGAEFAILEKMKLLGTNNILIKPLDKKKMKELKEAEEETTTSETKGTTADKFTPGLTLLDMSAIMKVLPTVESVSPEIILELQAINGTLQKQVMVVGINKEFLKINNFSINDGSEFADISFTDAENVCILGSGIRNKLFPTENPIGRAIKCGEQWLRVVGVLNEKSITKDNIQNLGIRDYNLDVYIPFQTMLTRFNNRTVVTKADLQRRSRRSEQEEDNNNQLDKITVTFAKSTDIKPSVEIIQRLMERRHNTVKDFEIIVPELLLEQEQTTKRIFNIVLGAIASISLIVGGIGIMNIMLASVLERTKEIGIRKAVGAKRSDILIQFLSEAVAISISGGIIGIILGVSTSYAIEHLTDIKTIVTPFSVIISFFVSITIGLIFGIAPARRASMEDTIELLRYE